MYRWADADQTGVIRDADGAWIPAVAGNADYGDVLRWVAVGNQIAAFVPDLARIKAEWRRRVDQDAETARMQFITPGAGMALTYQEKFAQANAVDDMGEEAANALAPEAAIAQFPILARSVGIEGDSLWACAQLVLARFQVFAAAAGQIEALRMAAKMAIAAAESEAEVTAIYAGLAWPTPQ